MVISRDVDLGMPYFWILALVWDEKIVVSFKAILTVHYVTLTSKAFSHGKEKHH